MVDVSDDGNFLEKFMKEHSIPKDALDHFSRDGSWLRKYLESPDYKSIPSFSRVLKRTGEDYFFSRTVATTETIPHLVTLQRKSFKLPAELPKGAPVTPHTTDPLARSPVEVPAEPDTCHLLSLGRSGLDGHPSVIHGGMSCAILDEMMGLCVMLHHQHISGPRDSLFTANLNVSYKAPVPTPSDVLVRCWLVGWEGRKWYSIGQIVGEDGTVYTEGRGVWVMARKSKA
jgi:acyl-coenzyme A thioesterase PaaI-like protein